MRKLAHHLVREHGGLIIILLVYWVLSLIYNLASPIFEPPDEATHFRYVKYLLDHKALPAVIAGPDRDEVWGLHQPPLYFLLSAALASPFELVAPNDFLARNPHVNLGFAQKPGNKNYYLHTEAEAFPYRGFPLLIRYLRLFSTLCGTITLGFVYLIGLEVFNGQKSLALLPPAFMTLQPEFVFINAEIANEPLNILLMAAGVWGCIRLIKDGPSTKLALFLGGVAGLIALTKMTGLALILLIVIAMLIAALKGHSARKLWLLGVIVVIVLLAIGGWWYMRNVFLYGDPWQAGMYHDFYGEVQRALTFADWYDGIKAGEVSFWATFGWFNIVVPEWIYTFYKILVRVGLAGLLVFLIRWLFYRRSTDEPEKGEGISPLLPYPPAPLLPLLASPLVSSLILARLIATEEGIQGRQLLPMLPALALLIVIGYRALLPGRWFHLAAIGVGVFMAGLTISMPFLYIAPAYAKPKQLAREQLPADMVPFERTYGDEIELLGYKLASNEALSGQLASITLYWQALKPVEKEYTVFVHALGRRQEKVGEYNGYPGQGNYPTSQWPTGRIIEDRYTFLIDHLAETPTLLRLHVGFFDFKRQDLPPLPVTDGQGNPVSSFIAQQVLLPGPNASMKIDDYTTTRINFADHITLHGYDYSGHTPDNLTLHWGVDAPPQQDYTVFIQLWQDGQQVAGFDGPPLTGDLPTTYWRPEQNLKDVHLLDMSQVPPGNYRLLVGLYNPQTGERLPAFAVEGTPLPDYAVDLGQIIVTSK